jgi:hypothetical protein
MSRSENSRIRTGCPGLIVAWDTPLCRTLHLRGSDVSWVFVDFLSSSRQCQQSTSVQTGPLACVSASVPVSTHMWLCKCTCLNTHVALSQQVCTCLNTYVALSTSMYLSQHIRGSLNKYVPVSKHMWLSQQVCTCLNTHLALSRQVRTCLNTYVALSTSTYLSQHRCGSLSTSMYMSQHIFGSLSTSMYLSQHICGSLSTSTYLSQHICGSLSTSTYLSQHICGYFNRYAAVTQGVYQTPFSCPEPVSFLSTCAGLSRCGPRASMSEHIHTYIHIRAGM